MCFLVFETKPDHHVIQANVRTTDSDDERSDSNVDNKPASSATASLGSCLIPNTWRTRNSILLRGLHLPQSPSAVLLCAYFRSNADSSHHSITLVDPSKEKESCRTVWLQHCEPMDPYRPYPTDFHLIRPTCGILLCAPSFRFST